jgi:UDP-N-acetylmuramyl pentapeptide phosphotransferase/UDP-N-acetylglucosamine-1-phosphate transferase
MLIAYKLIFGIVFHWIINLLVKKKNFLADDQSSSKHKKLASSNSSFLTGGLVFCFLFCIFVENLIVLKFFCILIFFTGLLSDLKLINNPYLRLIIQIFILTVFVMTNKINISATDLIFLDFFLINNFFSYFFTILCFLILINGTNFLDGLNTLAIGYYLISLLTLLFFLSNNNIIFDNNLIIVTVLILFINYIFNFLGKNFLGDSGAYTIAFITGYIIIDFYRNYSDFSVLFIVILLWYPAFEIFFSVIRKRIAKKNPYKPDNKHLHQLFFSYLNNLIKNKKISNTLSASIINFYHLIVVFVSYICSGNSFKLLIIIIFNILFYLSLYYFLNKKLIKLKLL